MIKGKVLLKLPFWIGILSLLVLMEVFILYGVPLIQSNELSSLKNGCLAATEVNQSRIDCLRPYFQKLTQRYSAEKAVDVALEFKKKGLIAQCHLIAHSIGEENYRKNKGDAQKAFLSCPGYCVQGCHHGVIKEYLSSTSSEQALLETLPSFCNDISDKGILKWQCSHGVGHGVYNHSSIPLNMALSICDKFIEPEHKMACRGGVFMEHMFGYIDKTEKELRASISTICSNIDGPFSKECFLTVGEGMVFFTGNNLELSRQLCQLASSIPVDQQACLRGIDIGVEQNDKDYEEFFVFKFD